MEVSKKPEILHFSVLNMTGLSAESREALFAFLHKATDDQYRGKVAMDYQDFIDNKLIEPTLSIEKIEEVLQLFEKELIGVYIYQWSLSTSSLRTKLIPLFDSIGYGIQSYKDVRMTVRIKKRFLEGLEEEIEVQKKLSKLSFKSKYSFPLFYLLEKTSVRTLSKKQLQALFRSPGGYKTSDLNRKVFAPALADLKPLYPFLRVERTTKKDGKNEITYFTFNTDDPAIELIPSKKATAKKIESKKEILKRKESYRKERLPLKRTDKVIEEKRILSSINNIVPTSDNESAWYRKRSLSENDPLPPIEQIESILRETPYQTNISEIQKELDEARKRSVLHNWKGFLIYLAKKQNDKN